ncbi:DUF418 domain-containing protein [Streptosporangium roseum]|uniref:DUF418 domain-containing protein n=1 Tax=Streptosporangium roseum (strain ATCC 12428 / DSM 43021 / JCM 3005 / KCTC 9067 / NCIMB 10171 / NRRL 2505 / NI 9100) TaxID=479432 RepID=D2AVX6_STRRD|nr:DUF418 domain-containing protein [Streptosporangium roseum]ACZ83095.1 conserved hypothetical protein [Streptosporangium roseum DSM 43021]
MAKPLSATAPTHVTTRSLAPDLARGFMLLLIALAHAPAFVGDWDAGPAALNTAAKFVKSLFADNQARSMFVLLFGYGLGQLAHRQHARGDDWTSVRKLLRRRAFWLIVIGFANTVLLVPIDIIAVYGLTLLVLAPLVRARDSVLWWTSILTLIPATLLLAWQSVAAQAGPVTMAEFMEPTFGAHLVASIPSWPVETAISTIIVVPGMLVGIWAARRRILDEPERHASLLRRITVIFIGVSVIGRLPAALLAAGAWTTTSAPIGWTIAIAHDLTGYAGGIGMAAAAGLVAIRVRRGRLITALAALGQRSLTFYLLQSVVWVALFYPFTLGLRDDMSFAATFGIAIGLWVASVLLAEWMRRAGYRGPAEVLLRRLSYRRPAPASVSDEPHGSPARQGENAGHRL